MQLNSAEQLKLKPYGHWRLSDFGGVSIIAQSAAKNPVPVATRASKAQPYRKKFSYAGELWSCYGASLFSFMPNFLYWYYYWFG